MNDAEHSGVVGTGWQNASSSGMSGCASWVRVKRMVSDRYLSGHGAKGEWHERWQCGV